MKAVLSIGCVAVLTMISPAAYADLNKPASQSIIVVPTAEEAMPAPGWLTDADSVVRELKLKQEKTITDRAFPLLAAKWPFNFIAVCWENPSETNKQERILVEDAIRKTWQANSDLKFTSSWQKCESNNLGIRISIQDVGPHVKYLGRYLNGVPDGMVLNFSFNNWSQICKATAQKRRECIESIAVHEFGHAIGFAHEQNRPDTPGECASRKQGSNGDDISITPWDVHSVMNYCNPIYNNGGRLSNFDKEAVAFIYGGAKP